MNDEALKLTHFDHWALIIERMQLLWHQELLQFTHTDYLQPSSPCVYKLLLSLRPIDRYHYLPANGELHPPFNHVPARLVYLGTQKASFYELAGQLFALAPSLNIYRSRADFTEDRPIVTFEEIRCELTN